MKDGIYSDLILRKAEELNQVLEKDRLDMAIRTYGHMKYPFLIGVTGTKGKTTIASLIYNIFNMTDKKCGMCGTLGAYIDEKIYEEKNTTPDPVEIKRLLEEASKSGCYYFVMEVSSQALKQARVAGLNYAYGIFTNISRDHIGQREHMDMEEYIFCKSMLFEACDITVANENDESMEQILKYNNGELITYGVNDNGNIRYGYLRKNSKELLRMRVLRQTFEGMAVRIISIDGRYNGEVFFPQPGAFNLYNLTAAVAIAYLEKVDFCSLKNAVENIKLKGRLEKLRLINGAYVVIDYAHNGASMETVLKDGKNYGFKRIVAVFGCGGNRSKDRRYDMGEVAGRLCDMVILTEDNSRYEPTENIIKDIEKGVLKSGTNYVIIKDRRKAIEYAINNSRLGDVIYLLGKGHEEYIECCGRRIHFSERQIAEEINKKLMTKE